ncbi:DUF3693 domain-containing protein [Coralloluteibacterium thermophilus]|uniref:DUF3693 domain-containing protein n=1 Tax=Coralloluteibacterium thermophilum TaxID=2707049 RepID=A0ABV9NLT0_9GAMM
MTAQRELLDKVKKARSFNNDADIARLLKVKPSLISGWKSGTVPMPDERIAQLCDASGEDGPTWMLRIHVEKATDKTERKLWAAALERLSPVAAAVGLAFVLGGYAPPGRAEGLDKPTLTCSSNIYYAKYRFVGCARDAKHGRRLRACPRSDGPARLMKDCTGDESLRPLLHPHAHPDVLAAGRAPAAGPFEGAGAGFGFAVVEGPAAVVAHPDLPHAAAGYPAHFERGDRARRCAGSGPVLSLFIHEASPSASAPWRGPMRSYRAAAVGTE